MTVNKHILLFASVASLMWLAGCTKSLTDEVPSYIAVDSISLSVSPIQGTASHKIVDTWVYAGSDLVGGFELPAKFPVLKDGNTELTLLAGIKMNGINETRVPYPFYETIKKTVNLQTEKVTDLGHIRFSYKASTQFAWQESFEQYSFSLDSTSRSEVNLYRVAVPELSKVFPYEINQYAGRVLINDKTSVFECQSHNWLKLPTDGRAAFLELNYKSNNTFTVGLVIKDAVSTQHSILVVNPSQSWNKIYINLTPALTSNTSASNFKVYFAAMKDDDVDKAEIYFDNIKLVHF